MDDMFTIAHCVVAARPQVRSPFAPSISWAMYTGHGANGNPTGTTGSKRLTPGHLMGALT
jgi:hypothetical protein